MLRKVSTLAGGGLGLSLLAAAFLAYFITEPGPRDGLGRWLTNAPWFARLFLGADSLWAGPGWFLVDVVIFFGGMRVAMLFVEWGQSTRRI